MAPIKATQCTDVDMYRTFCPRPPEGGVCLNLDFSLFFIFNGVQEGFAVKQIFQIDRILVSYYNSIVVIP